MSAVVTNEAVSELQLATGKPATALIKASQVMLGVGKKGSALSGRCPQLEGGMKVVEYPESADSSARHSLPIYSRRYSVLVKPHIDSLGSKVSAGSSAARFQDPIMQLTI